MKLNYDKKSKNPTYFIQQAFRNGTKVTSKNIHRIGKHSELLLITDDPLTYAKEQVNKMNKDYEEGKIDLSLKIDFNEKLAATGDISSKSATLNVGYFIVQKIYQDLRLWDFFTEIKAKKKITFDLNTVNRFLTYARILDPVSKLGTFDKLETYYEKPSFGYHHILRLMDILNDNYTPHGNKLPIF